MTSLLFRSAAWRLRWAGGAAAVLWAAVLWAILTKPEPPKPRDVLPPDPPSFRLVAATGQKSPAGGAFDRFDVETQPIAAPVNARGQVAFYAALRRTKALEGLFLSGPSGIAKIAAAGDVLPGGGVLSRFAGHPLPGLNDSGTVVFGAALTAARAAEGIFLARDGVVTPVVLAGTDAPGLVGASFSGFDTPVLNNQGDVAFVAEVRRGRETFQVLYIYGNGRMREIAAEGDPVPGGGRFDKLGVPALNNRGVVAFPAALDHAQATGGIFVGGARDLKMLVGAGAAAPNGQTIVRFSERIAIDDEDDIAFGAQLGIGRAGTEAILSVNTAGVTQIALDGDPAPGGGRFAGFAPWPSTGPAGRIVFVAAVDGAPGPLGIYAWRDGALSRIVLAGDKTPDGTVLAPFAINAVATAGSNGGLTFATVADPAEGGGRIWYFGPGGR